MERMRVGIVGDYDAGYISHRETGASLESSAKRLGLGLEYEWVATDGVGSDTGRLDAFDGVWAAPGSPYRSLDGALAAIRYARERDRPFLGT